MQVHWCSLTFRYTLGLEAYPTALKRQLLSEAITLLTTIPSIFKPETDKKLEINPHSNSR